MGQRVLRQWLLCPSSESNVLEDRYDAVELLSDILIVPLIKQLSSHLVHCKDVSKILHRIRHVRGNDPQ